MRAYAIFYKGKITNNYHDLDIFKTKKEAVEHMYEDDVVIKIEIKICKNPHLLEK